MISKKLLAVAVAGALAAPAAAFAQSSVTISGVLKVGVDNINLSNTRRTGNTSETRVTDNSSRIIFGMNEDLGNGLAAVGQIDVRFSTDISANAYPAPVTNVGASTMSANGNTFAGLRSKTWGQMVFGRHDLHYGMFEINDMVAKAGALMSSTVSLFDYIGTTAIAGTTRTSNVVKYDSPVWNGFDLTAAWSANPTGPETDLLGTGVATSTARKGQAWNFNPRYNGGNWGVRWSYWQQKSDGNSSAPALGTAACTASQTANGGLNVFNGGTTGCLTGFATPSDQQANALIGWMQFGGLKVGAGWNKSKLTATDSSNALWNNGGTAMLVGPGGDTSMRTAWTIPIGYVTGPHNFQFHYTKAGDNKVANLVNAANPNGTANLDGARMWAAGYVYDLSKRTSVGLTYSKIQNNTNGVYNFFTNASTAAATNGVFGSPGSNSAAGETTSLMAATVRHAF